MSTTLRDVRDVPVAVGLAVLESAHTDAIRALDRARKMRGLYPGQYRAALQAEVRASRRLHTYRRLSR